MYKHHQPKASDIIYKPTQMSKMYGYQIKAI